MALSMGDGSFSPRDLGSLGRDTVLEPGALVFAPQSVRLGANVYVGHYTMLVGDSEGEIVIGDGTWIGPQCWLQGAGGVEIGRDVGIGPGVRMLTCVHAETPPGGPITGAPTRFGRITIGDGCDIGVGAVLLPGATLGEGIQVGAGAVIRGTHAPGSVIAGVPAQALRERGNGNWAAGLELTKPNASG